MNKISIIMATFNSEKTVLRSMTSILNQSYSNFELIVCDDGSTDSTLGILQSLSSSDSRIIILSNKKNIGLAKSLNLAIDKSTTDIICRFDSDDFSFPDRIEKQLMFFIKNDFDLLGSDCYYTKESRVVGFSNVKKIVSKHQLYFKNQFIHPTTIMKKSILLKVGKYSVFSFSKKSQDYDLWLKFFSKIKNLKAGNLKLKLIEYNVPLKKRNFKEYLFVSYLILRSIFIYSSFQDIIFLPLVFKPIASFFVPFSTRYK
jgi:glycosyltransferase EpsE